ncbi:glycoside hydrolase family 32 protein [Salisediminibacterium halotolerans]|uniref:glycoside hydrolase family 32 protein n=1 Tax=Salisediminibacterium halotolerans TaxID=517425 RepID=UPI000EABB08E|nr:glycoside hydrolase family 32 protein [Salisediminibacterium halotolerans]RLJ78274.1 levanase [Actinophytocola xinjiangensis]RPE88387.1 levanase [Salisediminibacterium halotolerans]TWG37251.1 levanase [Salisediminibacterium halotolerans]GEL07730.1 hypothetical protein SHA02_11460 [Salisediminibacterium halotolerans]
MKNDFETLNAKSTYQEMYRPQLHFTPEEMWMNDPNGLVYFQGEYHLFYQYHPFSKRWGPMHWGHAVSKDLLHWEHLPIALFPDEIGMIFSGSCVVDENNTSGLFEDEGGLVAVFTHADDNVQQQSIAYSLDAGRTWQKYDQNPVIENPGIEDFRDPKVMWYEPEEKWLMVLAAGQEVLFYESKNLLVWTYLSAFGKGHGAHEGVWECPDLLEMPVKNSDETKWILQVDVDEGASAGGSGGQYFIGNFDGKQFISDHKDVRWADYGKDFYAAQSFSNIDRNRRTVWLAWMSNWLYANEVPTSPWRSAMSLPREVSLQKTDKNDYVICQIPVKEYEALKTGEKISTSFALMNSETRKEEQPDGPFEWLLQMNVKQCESFEAALFEFNGKAVRLIYDQSEYKLRFDRSQCGVHSFSEDFPGVFDIPVKKTADVLTLKIVVDTSSIELFINDGDAAAANLFFPSPDIEHFSLSVTCKKGDLLQVDSSEIQPLKSVWRDS